MRVGAGLRRVVNAVVSVAAAGGCGEKVWMPQAPGAIPDVGIGGPGGAAGGSSCSSWRSSLNSPISVFQNDFTILLIKIFFISIIGKRLQHNDIKIKNSRSRLQSVFSTQSQGLEDDFMKSSI